MSANTLVESIGVANCDTRLFARYSIGGMTYEPLTIAPLQLTYLFIFSFTDTHWVCPTALVPLKQCD